MLKRTLKVIETPLAILAFCLLAYAPLITSLGFYWDDWPMMWFAHTLGPLGFPSVFAGDRPFLSWIYVVTTSIFNTTPLPWQILGILTRWATALSVWWSIRKLWPLKPERAFWIAVLIAIYPGFKEMPIAVVFANGLLLLAPYFLSFGLMIESIRKPSRYWLYTILALISYSFCTFSTEYYIGLDFIRPFLIFLVVSENSVEIGKRIKTTLRYYLPYLIILVIFLYWRVFIFKFPTYQPVMAEGALTHPLSVLYTLLTRIPSDLVNTGWNAWIEPFRFPKPEDFAASSSLAVWALIAVSIPITYFLLKRHNADASTADEKGSSSWPKTSILIGLLILVFAGFPFWITGLRVDLHYYYDRFTLAYMLGSCLLLVGLVDWFIHTRNQKIILLSLIISMSIGEHFLNTNTYRREWNLQKEFFWQLVWRAPGLKEGTYLLTQSLPLEYYSDNSLTAPLNWTYAPENRTLVLPYFMGLLETRISRTLAKIPENKRIHETYRNADFRSNLMNGLVFQYSPPGCLKIIDPRRDISIPDLSPQIIDSMHLSHPDQIITDPPTPAMPPLEIFGAEPSRNWCYYYEKADLARQKGDWQQVYQLGIEAKKENFSPIVPFEKVLFLEAQAHIGQVKEAMDETWILYQKESHLQPALCDMLKRLESTQDMSRNDQNKILAKEKSLDCKKAK